MHSSIAAAKLLGALLLPAAAVVAQTGSSCNLFTDPCTAAFQFDLECDDPSGLNLCPLNSDCFDCDPLMQFRNQGCEVCTNNGGGYCETGDGTPICSSPEIAVVFPDVCTDEGGTPYTAFCGDNCGFQFNLECDAGTTFCPPSNSDIFDCDPFQNLRSSGCEECVGNGGRYCETGNGIPVCSSPDIAEFLPEACSIVGRVFGGLFDGTPYMSSCGGDDSPPVPSPISTSVSPPTPGSDDGGGGGSSGGLAALSVLALIPIAGIGYFIYWYRKQSAGEGSHGKLDDNAEEVTGSNNTGNQVNQLEDRQPWLSSRNNDASRVNSRVESVSVPASHDSDSGFPSSASEAPRVHQDPLPDPPAVAVSTHAVPAAPVPGVKDQCREVIPDPQSNGPPLAHAIVIEPSDIEDLNKSA